MLVRGEYRTEVNKGEKKWDKCNSIINKIYFKQQKKSSLREGPQNTYL